jgi:hypothetical protein
LLKANAVQNRNVASSVNSSVTVARLSAHDSASRVVCSRLLSTPCLRTWSTPRLLRRQQLTSLPSHYSRRYLLQALTRACSNTAWCQRHEPARPAAFYFGTEMPALVGVSSEKFLAIINSNTVQQLREGCPGRVAEPEVCPAVHRQRVCRVTCRIGSTSSSSDNPRASPCDALTPFRMFQSPRPTSFRRHHHRRRCPPPWHPTRKHHCHLSSECPIRQRSDNR